MARFDVGSNPVNAWRSRWGTRSGGVARWLRPLPFLSVHLSCLVAFFTGVNRLTLLLCAAPDFAEANRSQAREALLLTTTVAVPHAGAP